MLSWWRDTLRILESEDETELAYLYGQQMGNLSHLKEIKPRLRGAFFRVLMFFRFILGRYSFGNQPIPSGVSYLVFAGTSNQMSALESSVRELESRGKQFLAIGNKSHLTANELGRSYVPCAFTGMDIIKALTVLIRRGAGLHKRLRENYPAFVTNRLFGVFLEPYIFIPYFLRILRSATPGFVLVSNDHNVENRCLIAVAHYLGIPTVYMQHASVSKFFPALRFDYAFLDGEQSLHVYERCECNAPGARSYPVPVVFLSGQKRVLGTTVRGERAYVGLAVNTFDPVEAIVETVTALAQCGIRVMVRWHPSQTKNDIAQLKESLVHEECVKLSDPSIETVVPFLHQCHSVVAGNSSIHLEAACSGARSIYYEITPSELHDYYGYVAAGLASRVQSITELLAICKRPYKPHLESAQRRLAIRRYSESHGTEWQGNEGKLVIQTLENVQQGIPITELYRLLGGSPCFSKVYGLTSKEPSNCQNTSR